MIDIKIKEDCCGCESCVQRCPKNCITMYEDEEGFLYPKVNHELCINCSLCEKVCPILNNEKERTPIEVYAAKNSNDFVREKSSSGGIFSILAEQVILKEGVVFGVKYNEHWEAVHSYTETLLGIQDFRTSKYIQSKVGNAYKEVETFLKKGRFVLFTGTPCQILGLRKFLRKEYNNLLLVDFICHGTPSPGVFRLYMKELLSEEGKTFKGVDRHFEPINTIPQIDELAKEVGITIRNINFRDKRLGWKNFSFVLDYAMSSDKETIHVYSSTATQNSFLKGFFHNLYLRPSCYSCPVRGLSSGSDLTLGDYWGIEGTLPGVDDDRGISTLIVNTLKGVDFVENLEIEKYSMDYGVLCKQNPSLLHSSKIPVQRTIFFTEKNKSFSQKIKDLTGKPIIQRIVDFSKEYFIQISRKLIGRENVRKLKNKLK